MNDLAQLSLPELRDVAFRLSVRGARTLPRSELLVRLAPLGEKATALIALPLSGRLVASRPAPFGMTAHEPVGAGAPTTSGAGRASPEPVQAPPFLIPDLPWAYDDDRLVLLVRDPRTLFAYWDLHPATVEAAARGLGDSKAYLRVWALGGAEASLAFEFQIDLGGRAYYVSDCEPHRDYRVELLLRGASGEERRVGHQSNVASLPPNKPSAWVEDRFVSIPIDVALPAAALFAAGGRVQSESEKRLHARAFELSGGEIVPEEGAEPSSGAYAKGFGGRFWSGSLVRK